MVVRILCCEDNPLNLCNLVSVDSALRAGHLGFDVQHLLLASTAAVTAHICTGRIITL